MKNPQSQRFPKIAEWLLSHITESSIRYSVLGDFEEQFQYYAEEHGRLYAHLWCWLQIMKSLPPFIFESTYWSLIMLKNYFKVAFRNLLNQKVYSFINIAGLAIGLATCLLITIFVIDELSYDRHHEKASQIYRVVLDLKLGDTEIKAPLSSTPMAQTLVRDFPEVLFATRIIGGFFGPGTANIRYGVKVFKENKVLYADSSFFDVFTVPFISGDAKIALNQPNTIVITKAIAEKYFGTIDPMGKMLIFSNLNSEYKITGVVENNPANSHFHFDFLAALSSLPRSRSPSWTDNSFYTYIVLQNGISQRVLEAKFPAMVRKYIGPQLKTIGVTLENMADSGDRWVYLLEALTDIHLHANSSYEFEPNGNIVYVTIFSSVAILILLIACINFINLTTARSTGRAKEVGVRKVLGSHRKQLVQQFLVESLFVTFLAFIIAISLANLALPLFNSLSGKNMTMAFFQDGYMLSGLFGLFLLVGLLSGIYPAVVLSSFRPIQVLKGKLGTGNQYHWLRSSLVIFQFTISMILIVGALVVNGQLEYMQNKKLGFNQEHILVIDQIESIGEKIPILKQKLLAHPNVKNATVSLTLPGKMFPAHPFQPQENDRTYVFQLLTADPDFIPTFEINLLTGRNFSKNISTDSDAFILNEAAVVAFGWNNADAIGKQFKPSAGFAAKKVVGVVKDFNFKSLHDKIEPLVIAYSQNGQYMSVRVEPTSLQATVAFLENKWREVAPDKIFEYTFLDQSFEALYNAEKTSGQVFAVFAGLAIFIACLGLFGLTSFLMEKRSKEVALRKIVGATVAHVVVLLSRDFGKLVIIAIFIATPIAYFVMNNWLQYFAYREALTPLPFILAGIATLFISLLTVVNQVIKSALANPIDSI